jgi:hypothetical protein
MAQIKGQREEWGVFGEDAEAHARAIPAARSARTRATTAQIIAVFDFGRSGRAK